jgi:hypothetical protein
MRLSFSKTVKIMLEFKLGNDSKHCSLEIPKDWPQVREQHVSHAVLTDAFRVTLMLQCPKCLEDWVLCLSYGYESVLATRARTIREWILQEILNAGDVHDRDECPFTEQSAGICKNGATP